MRNRSFLFLIFLCCGLSCKQYLKVDPVSSFGPDYVFGNVANAEKAVLGAYAPLTGDFGYGIRINMYYAYDSDEMMGQGGTPYPDNERRDLAHYTANPNNTQLVGPYSQLYTGVERANLCIAAIPEMAMYQNGTATEKAQLRRMHGEALTLRAQYYYELIRNWGDVPGRFLPAIEETNRFMAKTDRDSIYDKLLTDLELAATLLPWRTETTVKDERITQGAARALRARIALTRGGFSLRRSKQMERPADYKKFYEIARNECKAIMDRRGDHNLNPSYQAVFKDNICAHKIDPLGEVIFEVAMSGGSSLLGDSKMGYYNGPRYFPSSSGLGNSALTILPSYFYTFDSTDTRRDVTCVAYDLYPNERRGRTGPTLVDGKFRRDWITNPTSLTSSAQYFGLNWPLIRFSDVLLMYAEAENELGNGPSAAAIAAFEEVRKRGYGGNAALIGVTPTTKDGFFNAIVKERMLEFGGEGIRKYDLIRWNLLKTKLDEAKATLLAMSNRTAPWNTYPDTMYYKNASADLVWAGSYYKPKVTPAPSGYTKVAWITSAINTTIIRYFAIGFTPGKSELLPIGQAVIDANPNLKQDYGY
ncbi:RagB/SusD family nutrient uptake outer membrane protein [Chitinophaga lutea]